LTSIVAVLCLVLASSAGGATQLVPIVPGGKIGTMRLARGTAAGADAKLFDFCDPVITGPAGRHVHRTCPRVPQVRRLFIGYGSFFADPAALDSYWKATRWQLWLDGRRVALRAFGTSDRILVAFPPAGGKSVTLREWRVMVVGPSLGSHTIRYQSKTGNRTGEATWIFHVYRP
jgi:hypothetical protein